MIVMNRRDLLKGLAVLPVVNMLSTPNQLAQTPNDTKFDPAECSPIPVRMDYVNIIFHGAWIYLFYDDHILALAPRIEADPVGGVGHVAAMGGKTDKLLDCLPSGFYELKGFECNPYFAPPDPWQSVVIDAHKARIRKIDCSASNLYYCIRLPFPDAMTPSGHMRLRSTKGKGDPFQARNGYLKKMLNRRAQLFPSVQIFTYRPSVIGGVTAEPRPKPRDAGCYEDACYRKPIVPPLKLGFVKPGFKSVVSCGSPASESASLIPFEDSYSAPDGTTYAQYHVAYLVHRRNESGHHEDHSFTRLSATLGMDVISDFCNYRFEELPMSMPIGLTPSQVNLDDFPIEITISGKTGWYTKSAALPILEALETNEARLSRDESNLFDAYDKPIGNCRSGHLVVINPPSLGA